MNLKPARPDKVAVTARQSTSTSILIELLYLRCPLLQPLRFGIKGVVPRQNFNPDSRSVGINHNLNLYLHVVEMLLDMTSL